MKQFIIIALASLSLLTGVTGALLENNNQEITANAANFQSTESIIDAPKMEKIPPTIVGQKDWIVTQGEQLDVLEGVMAKDHLGNELAISVSSFTTDVPKIQLVTLTAIDGNENKTEETITVTIEAVKKNVISKKEVTSDSTMQTHKIPNIEPTDVSTTAPINETKTAQAMTTPYEPQQSVAPQTNTLAFKGVTIPYQNAGEASGQSIINNDRNMVATFGGATYQSADDGLNTHFIGHNPGIFSHLFSLAIGDTVVVTDSNGTPSTYVVSSIFEVDDYGTDLATNENRIDYILDPGSEERITLQTCINQEFNLVVVAFPA